MNLGQLRAFDMVLRTGSFTAAAKRLHVSQPAVTNHVRALEARYDVSLFRRQGRGVAPTALGESLSRITRRLFAVEEEAADLLQSNHQLRGGTLRLAADGPYFLVPLVAAFKNRYPGVKIAMSVSNTRAVEAALLDEQCDLTLQGLVSDDRRLHVVPLTTHSLVVFVGRDHPWAHAGRATINMRELDGAPVILREAGSTMRPTFERACAAAAVTPDFAIETTSRETVKEAVAAGLGIGVISEAEMRPDDRFFVIRIEDADLSYTENVLCLEHRRNLRVVSAFLQIVAEQFDTDTEPDI